MHSMAFHTPMTLNNKNLNFNNLINNSIPSPNSMSRILNLAPDRIHKLSQLHDENEKNNFSNLNECDHTHPPPSTNSNINNSNNTINPHNPNNPPTSPSLSSSYRSVSLSNLSINTKNKFFNSPFTHSPNSLSPCPSPKQSPNPLFRRVQSLTMAHSNNHNNNHNNSNSAHDNLSPSGSPRSSCLGSGQSQIQGQNQNQQGQSHCQSPGSGPGTGPVPLSSPSPTSSKPSQENPNNNPSESEGANFSNKNHSNANSGRSYLHNPYLTSSVVDSPNTMTRTLLPYMAPPNQNNNTFYPSAFNNKYLFSVNGMPSPPSLAPRQLNHRYNDDSQIIASPVIPKDNQRNVNNNNNNSNPNETSAADFTYAEILKDENGSGNSSLNRFHRRPGSISSQIPRRSITTTTSIHLELLANGSVSTNNQTREEDQDNIDHHSITPIDNSHNEDSIYSNKNTESKIPSNFVKNNLADWEEVDEAADFFSSESDNDSEYDSTKTRHSNRPPKSTSNSSHSLPPNNAYPNPTSTSRIVNLTGDGDGDDFTSSMSALSISNTPATSNKFTPTTSSSAPLPPASTPAPNAPVMSTRRLQFKPS